MRKQKIIRKIFTVFLIAIFVLSPIKIGSLSFEFASAVEIPEEEKWTNYDDYIVIDEDTTWSGNVAYNDPDKPVVVVNGATLTIKKGTHIEIVDLEVRMGRIVAEGTQDEKIVFTKADPDYSGYPEGTKPDCMYGDRGLVKFSDSAWANGYGTEPSIMRYVDFENMGSYDFFDEEECACPECTAFDNFIRNSIFNIAQAAEPDRVNPALKFVTGRLHIENSSFKNNDYADIEVDTEYYDEGLNSYLEVVNSNFEGNKQETALVSSAKKYSGDEEPVSKGGMVVMKNNWYGNSQGPTRESDLIDKGEKIEGDYTLSGFRTKSLIADPVIIIPGIMGSASEYVGGIGKLKLDPILGTYNNLLASFEKNKYEKNKNLFEFPYEWRNSNVITADLLKQKIQDVKNSTGVSKVDLVAHSMGGLVARYYIESDDYQGDVDQLITLGTPHRGSPKSYMNWEAGEVGTGLDDYAIKKIFQVEAHHAGYSDLKEYIQNKIKSVEELLPNYDYLEEASSGEMKNYPAGYPGNTFLESLNTDNKIKKLEKINLVNIVGKLDSEKTIKKFRVVDSIVPGKWEHGMPENFYDSSTDRGMEYGKGDGTVPFSSAEVISADKKIEINSEHLDLPTKAQCYIIKELTGKDSCEYANTFKRITSVLTFGVFSPVDIQVIDPDGKKVGKNLESGGIINEIEGAYYSGSGADNEFLVIPDPKDGEYKIIAQGTGNGSYKIETSKISEDSNYQATEKSFQDITGTAVNGQQEEKIIEVKDDEETENNDTASNDSSSSSTANSAVANDNSSNDNKDNNSKTENKEEVVSDYGASENIVSQPSENSGIFENINKFVSDASSENGIFPKGEVKSASKSVNDENSADIRYFSKWVIFIFSILVIFGFILFIRRRAID
ncbi:MAG: hypothetical protein V1804_04135 [Patescibacteria group bacterium]